MAYEWILENCVDPNLMKSFIDTTLSGTPQYFYDFGNNGDINNTNMALAHFALLAQYAGKINNPHLNQKKQITIPFREQ